MKDKIAIVTGASQGTGKRSPVGLERAGGHLVLARHPGGNMQQFSRVQSAIDDLGRAALIAPHRHLAVDTTRYPDGSGG